MKHNANNGNNARNYKSQRNNKHKNNNNNNNKQNRRPTKKQIEIDKSEEEKEIIRFLLNYGANELFRVKKDDEDVFWFDYEYYGFSEDIEYTITYKYEVIDSRLNFSSTDDQIFIFNLSERNYSKDSVDTGEIIELEGCTFY